MKKRVLCGILSGLLVLSLAGCGAAGKKDTAEVKKINIAYQYGLAYAPAVIAKEKDLIEKAYEEQTGEKVEVTWTQMNSGADINTGISAGEIQVGFVGVGPALTGITNQVGYKVFSNVSGQPHGAMTNDEDITSLESLVGSDKQLAVVNIGSFQHIVLAKALVNEGLDAHALDQNLIAMKHPDGMSSLETGSVAVHVTTSPYLQQERQEENLYEIPSVSAAWSPEDSFIVGVAGTDLYENDQELYQAVCEGISDAIDMINDDVEAAAGITCESSGNTLEDEIRYMKDGKYSTRTSKLFELAQFMGENKFIDNSPETYQDLVFDNVQGD